MRVSIYIYLYIYIYIELIRLKRPLSLLRKDIIFIYFILFRRKLTIILSRGLCVFFHYILIAITLNWTSEIFINTNVLTNMSTYEKRMIKM